MLDSIKLYEIVDAVNAKTDIVHPSVKSIFGEGVWALWVSDVSRHSARMLLTMRWPNSKTIRYKWFRRVVDMLNNHAKGSNIVFIADLESFEVDFKNGVDGTLCIYAELAVE
jgi:hypothetical protein